MSQSTQDPFNKYISVIRDLTSVASEISRLEQHRMQQQKALGWDTFTLKQILKAASPEQRITLSPLFEALEQQLNRLAQARDASERILGVRLHEMEILAMRQQGSSYNSEGNASPAGGKARIRDTYV